MTQSLSRIHLRVSLILLLCIAAAALAAYLALRDMQQSAFQESTAMTARAASERITQRLTQQHQSLEKIAQQPAILNLLQREDSAGQTLIINELKTLLPDAVAIHLLPRNSAGTLRLTEKLEPACVDFIQRASMSATPPAPEFHAIGTAAEHYDMAVPVRDETRKPAGYLLVSFSPAPLLSMLTQTMPPNGYMELQQPLAGNPAQAVLIAGTASTATSAIVTSTLGDSRWTLMFQSGDVPAALFSGNRIYYFVFILLAVIVIFFTLFQLYLQTASAVKHDIRSLIRMFHDLREGGVRVDYPMALSEFSEVFNYLRQRGKKLVEEKQKLKDMGLMDHLSQLGNRRHFEQRLKELFEASKANGPSSVLMIDMDYFKQVNDKHGHDAGDALIVGFANALRKAVRQTDVLARLGGDEFCIIYTYAPLAKATALVERLRKHLPREIPLTKGVMHQLRWTGGLSVMDDKDTKPDDVLWRADQALLQAKEGGRNITLACDPATGLPEKKRSIVS
jgi:diguanylate cyclase (GGDEF)-like protein